jgi:hypothetical protein
MSCSPPSPVCGRPFPPYLHEVSKTTGCEFWAVTSTHSRHPALVMWVCSGVRMADFHGRAGGHHEAVRDDARKPRCGRASTPRGRKYAGGYRPLTPPEESQVSTSIFKSEIVSPAPRTSLNLGRTPGMTPSDILVGARYCSSLRPTLIGALQVHFVEMTVSRGRFWPR